VPSSLGVGLGLTFTVDIGVANATDLFCWQVDLYYQNTILTCTRATEGPFLKALGSTIWVVDNNINYNSTHGVISFGSSLIGETPGATGNGILATLSFETLTLGTTTLDIANAIVLNRNLLDMPFTVVDGFVEVRTPTHDIAVSSVVPYKNVVGQGFTTEITVNVENRGDFSETFEVTAYYDSNILGTQTITNIPPLSRLSLTFVWDTTGVSTGYYAITATKDAAVGQANLALEAMETGATVYVGVPGDVNGDHVVNMRDIGDICWAFGSAPGSSRYVARCDIIDNAKIDMRDIGVACGNFGRTDP